MYPMWLTRVNDSMRLISFWAIAPRMPTSIVAAPAIPSTSVSGSAWNSRVWVRMIAYTPTLVSSPANTAVTGAGAVG